MKNKRYRFLLLTIVLLLGVQSGVAQDKQSSMLAGALSDMYTTCLFPNSGFFDEAIGLAQAFLAPGISAFIENNMAAVPLTPPNLEIVTENGMPTAIVTGFSPLFSESSSTIGGGRFLVGGNFTYLDLSRIRGRDLQDIEFQFVQDGGSGDLVTVTMPLDISASVFSLYGTVGLTDRLDLGFSIPIVNLTIASQPTNFRISGSNTGLSYGGSDNVDYDIVGDNVSIGGNVRDDLSNVAVPESELYVSTVALRLKYRFPVSVSSGRVAAVLDMRLPVGRSESNFLGKSNFGTRLTFVGEYQLNAGFKPYLNVGAQFWNGEDSNNIRVSGGFSQRVVSDLFFAFDLLGELDLEATPFFDQLDDEASLPLVGSNIPALARDHTLNAGAGFRYIPTPGFQIYGSALFALTDSGLSSTIAPSVGLSIDF